MRLATILNALGIILFSLGFIVLSPALVALLYRDYLSIPPFAAACCSSVAIGLLCRRYGGFACDFDQLRRTEAMLIVVLAWIMASGISTIPYLFYGLPLIDACFEAVSGITSTGSTILQDFSAYPKAFFFWRSLSQWVGAMGIIVLFVAILPQFAIAGRRMFFTELPGPMEEKVTPRIKHTAKALWLFYLLLTLIEAALLWLAGMPLFDAVCNSFSTMAAAGFSPNPQSIMGYDNATVTWIVLVFMFLAGGNFVLQYRVLFQGKFRSLLYHEELRFYIIIILSMSFLLFLILMGSETSLTTGEGVRESLFQVVSVLTTSGFASSDFALWTIPAQTLLFTLMLIGGCAGSAAGGIKVTRVLFALKYLKREITQIVHPKAVLPLKMNRVTLQEDTQRQILGFLLFYMTLMTLSALAVSTIEGDMMIGIVGTASAIGNVGPGFGAIGPFGSFSHLSVFSKIIFIIDMLVGRLELVPFLAMFHPDFCIIKRGTGKQPATAGQKPALSPGEVKP